MTFITGYVRGRPIQLSVVHVDGFLVEVVTAEFFHALADAARKDGVSIRLTSGFRTNDEQTRLFLERSDPAVRMHRGVAAKPGYSNHQSGRAIDIHTGLTVASFREGGRSIEYDWLSQHARSFGFVRTVAAEPWHWEHTELPEDREA